MSDTAKNYNLKKAPKRIQLFGDKTKKIESSEHIIEFPGGAIEVARTTDGNYWAHIIINRQEAIEDCEGLNSAIGEVIGSRLDCGDGNIPDLPNQQNIRQIAVLIKTIK